eukprot:gene11176-13207_t
MAHADGFTLAAKLNNTGPVLKAPEGEERFWVAAVDYLKAGQNGIAKPVSKSSQRFALKSYLQPNDEEIWSRMMEESAMLEKLDHPNVACCLQRSCPTSTDTHGQQRQELRLMIELFARGSLEDLLANVRSPLSENDVLSYFHCALSAVVYIHREGMVHRNIKPSNLFVKDDGGLKLGDFGIERTSTSREQDAEKTSATGMLDYVAPEARNASGEYSTASDVWSLACVLCYLCNQPDGHMSTYQIPTYYSSWLEPLLLSMLMTNPTRRPSAESIMAALKYQEGRFSSRYDLPDKSMEADCVSPAGADSGLAAMAPTAGDLITNFQRQATGSHTRAAPPPATVQSPLTTPVLKSLNMVSGAKHSMEHEVQTERDVPANTISHDSPRLRKLNVHPNPMYGLEEAENSGRDPQPEENGNLSNGSGTESQTSEAANRNLSMEGMRHPVTAAHSLKLLQAVQATMPPERLPLEPQTLDLASASSKPTFPAFMFTNNEYNQDDVRSPSESVKSMLSVSTVCEPSTLDASMALTSPRSVKGSADLRRFLELKNAGEYHQAILPLVDARTWKEDLENISLDDLLDAGVKKAASLRILRAVRDRMQDLESLLRRTYSESLRPSDAGSNRPSEVEDQGSMKSERIGSEIGSVYEDAMSEVSEARGDGSTVSSFRSPSLWEAFVPSTSRAMEVIAEDPNAEKVEKLEKRITEIYEQYREELKEKLEQQAGTWMESTKFQLDKLKAELREERGHSAAKDAEIQLVVDERNELERRLAEEAVQCAELRQVIEELKEEQQRLTSGTLRGLAQRGEASAVEILLMKGADPNDESERDP